MPIRVPPVTETTDYAVSCAARLWRRFLACVAFGPLVTLACSPAQEGTEGVHCASGVVWAERIELQGATELDVTACLAGHCLSMRRAVTDPSELHCRGEPLESGQRQLRVCAFRVESTEGATDKASVEVNIYVQDARAEGLADGDEASLTVASVGGAVLYEAAGPVTYRVDETPRGFVCMTANASQGEGGAPQGEGGAPQGEGGAPAYL